EEEGPPAPHLGVLHLADVDHVVAALVGLDDPALDVRERPLQDERSTAAGATGDARELLAARLREPRREVLLVLGEDVHHELLRVEEVREGLRLLVDADEEERRRERERGDGVRREPVAVALRVARRDDRDAGREQSHHAPQLSRLEHGAGEHAWTLRIVSTRRALTATSRRRYPLHVQRLIDADGHVLEPPDVWARYVDPKYRERAIRVRREADGDVLEIDGRPAALTTREMLAGFGGMGKTVEELAAAALSGRYAENAPAAATDPAARLAVLDRDGLSHAILYPSLGLQWEAEVSDPAYALAHCRAYNRWIEEFCAGSGGRLVPVAHLSLGDAEGAAAELRRAVRAGARGAFVLPFTLDGLPHGHPAHDPLWAEACALDVPVAIHTGIDPPARGLHGRFDGLSWPENVREGIWYLQMMFPQAVQQAFTTFFLYGTFDRFPRL